MWGDDMKSVQEETKTISLQDKLDEFFMDRYSNSEETMPEDIHKDYKKAQNEYHEIYKKLREMLPESGNELLFELDSIIGTIITLDTGNCYNLGLKDGIELANGVGLSWLDYVLRPDTKKLIRVK